MNIKKQNIRNGVKKSKLTIDMMCNFAEKHSKLAMQLSALAFGDVINEYTTHIIIQPEDINMLRQLLLKYFEERYPDTIEKISDKVLSPEEKGVLPDTLPEDVILLILMNGLIKDIVKRIHMEYLLHVLMDGTNVTRMQISYERESNAIVVKCSIDTPTHDKTDNDMYR